MFTVKHINIVGEERLALVATARFSPGTSGNIQGEGETSPTPATVWIRYTDNSEELPLTGGTVFIMNENGKTVARYDLGASPVPLTIRESVLRSAGA